MNPKLDIYGMLLKNKTPKKALHHVQYTRKWNVIFSIRVHQRYINLCKYGHFNWYIYIYMYTGIAAIDTMIHITIFINLQIDSI